MRILGDRKEGGHRGEQESKQQCGAGPFRPWELGGWSRATRIWVRRAVLHYERSESCVQIYRETPAEYGAHKRAL